MSLLIGRYEFEGPLVNCLKVANTAGIYAVLSFVSNDEFEMLELGESKDLRKLIQNPGKQELWQNRSSGMLTFALHYCPRAGRRRRQEMANEILREFDGEYRLFEESRGLLKSGSL